MRFIIVCLCVCLSVPAMAKETVVISDAWARPTLGDVEVTAAFFKAENTSDADIKIITVKSNVSKATEIHTMTMGANGMNMERLDSLKLPAGKVTELKPGTEHVMLINVTKTLSAGDSFDLEIGFDDGSSQTVQVLVRALYTPKH